MPAYTFNGNYTGEALADLLLGQIYQFDANTQAVVEQLQNVSSALRAGRLEGGAATSRSTSACATTTPRRTTARGPNRNINFDPKTGQLVNAKNPTD